MGTDAGCPLVTHADVCEAEARRGAVAADIDRHHLARVTWRPEDPPAHGLDSWPSGKRLLFMGTGGLGGGGRPWLGRLQDSGSVTHRQMEGLKVRIPSPISSLTIWRATHSHGNVP